MYGSIREYKLRPGTAVELVTRLCQEFAPILTNLPGWMAYTVGAVGDDRIVTTSFFDSEAGAEESVRLAASWAGDTFDELVIGPPRVTTGEITVRENKDEVKAGYGIMRRFECTSENAAEITQRVRQGLVPLLNAMDGFAGFGLLIENGVDRGGASLSAFVDRATAEAANREALTWVKENVGSLLSKPPEIVVGEIKLRAVRSTVGAA